MARRESTPQKQIKEALEKEVGGTWYVIHGSPFQERGIPDIIGCCKGIFFGLEVKWLGETTTKYQDFQIQRINKSTGYATKVHTPKEALEFVINSLKKEGRWK